jgi:hypothetical protein
LASLPSSAVLPLEILWDSQNQHKAVLAYFNNTFSHIVHYCESEKQTGLKCVIIAGHIQVGSVTDYVKAIQKYH